jgi:hypothetical protein
MYVLVISYPNVAENIQEPPPTPHHVFLDATSARECSLNDLTQTFGKRCNIDINDLEDPCEQLCEHEVDNDNAYLHFDPEVDNQQQIIAPSGSYALPKATRFPCSPGNVSTVHSPEPKPKKTLQPQATCTADIRVKNLRTKETNPRRRRRLVEPEKDLDELWEEARMRDVIVRDADLHLRILRYEVSARYSMFLTALLTPEH